MASLKDALAVEEKKQGQLIALKAELMEALELQRETAVTTKRLGAIREAELGRALRVAESRIAEILAINASDAAVRQTRSREAAADVKEAKDAFATEHALAQERDCLKEKVGKLESVVAKLKRDAARVEVLERANVEMSAQLAFALRSSGVMSHAVKVTETAKCIKEEAVKPQPRQNRFAARARRNGMWAAVGACALAVVWSTAVHGK
jgi:hypothetical protein